MSENSNIPTPPAPLEGEPVAKNEKQPRMPKLWEALLSFGVLIAVMAAGIIIFEVDPHFPMFIGVIFSAIMAMRLGYSWEVIETAMKDGIYRALQAVIILMIVGILIAVWIMGGVVPAMIYYGMKLLSPKIFLIAALLICSITSLATGTSWGTMGTMGLALIGIAIGLGIPEPMAAGAVISGAYFGDKMSPLSDTTNLAPAMAGTDVMTHVKFMMLPTAITYGICIIAFGVMGVSVANNGAASTADIDAINNALMSNFNINPILLLPPVIVIVAVAKKVPAIPGITLGIIAGLILGLIFQPATFGDYLQAGLDGVDKEWVNDVAFGDTMILDRLLNSGGIMGMVFSITLTIIAMMFGGIMETTKQIEVVVNKLLNLVKGPAGLVTMTELTCVVSNATMPEQYISIVVPGRMYAETYDKMGLHPKSLSNALEGAGTVTSALIPCNTCGVYIYGILGLKAFGGAAGGYFGYAIFNWLMPLVVIALAFTGHTIANKRGERVTTPERKAEMKACVEKFNAERKAEMAAAAE